MSRSPGTAGRGWQNCNQAVVLDEQKSHGRVHQLGRSGVVDMRDWRSSSGRNLPFGQPTPIRRNGRRQSGRSTRPSQGCAPLVQREGSGVPHDKVYASARLHLARSLANCRQYASAAIGGRRNIGTKVAVRTDPGHGQNLIRTPYAGCGAGNGLRHARGATPARPRTSSVARCAVTSTPWSPRR